jgi:hypothetical protein
MERRPWVRDFAPVAGAFGLCPLVALAGGAERGQALVRAGEIADAEAGLGLFFEPAVHGWVAARPGLAAAAQAVYLVLHVPALIGALAFCYLARPELFPRARTAFLALQTGLAAVWLLLPTAPPRMLAGRGFEAAGGSAAERVAWLQSPYAAMPSGHVAFALLAGALVVLAARRPALRLAGALYPPLICAVTLATANHFWLDTAGAVVLCLVVGGLAVAVHRGPSARGVPAPEPVS